MRSRGCGTREWRAISLLVLLGNAFAERIQSILHPSTFEECQSVHEQDGASGAAILCKLAFSDFDQFLMEFGLKE